MGDAFYRAFEAKYRGSRKLIISRLAVYRPFITPLQVVYPGSHAIDLGCGRGEWLEILKEEGFTPLGIDQNEGMMQSCREHDMPVQQGDAIEFLVNLPRESQSIVSAFHVVEHLNFGQLQTVVSEALRVLKPGGLLIMETPNVENIVVATQNFYFDPTHQSPIPSQLLSFLPEFYGFARAKTLRLQESKELTGNETPSLDDVLGGASPDYAIIAQKTAPKETLEPFDKVFNQEYGLSLSHLVERFDKSLWLIKQKAIQADQKAVEAEQKAVEAEQKAVQAEQKAVEAEQKAVQADQKAVEAEQKAVQADQKAVEAEQKAVEAEQKAVQADQKAVQADQKAVQADQKAVQAEQKAVQAEQKTIDGLHAVHNSRSWRVTVPLRLAGMGVRWFVRGSVAWLTFAPQSRPRLVARQLAIRIKVFVSTRQSLKSFILRCLTPFPHLNARFERVGSETPLLPSSSDDNRPVPLSVRAMKIYNNMNDVLVQRLKE